MLEKEKTHTAATLVFIARVAMLYVLYNLAIVHSFVAYNYCMVDNRFSWRVASLDISRWYKLALLDNGRCNHGRICLGMYTLSK